MMPVRPVKANWSVWMPLMAKSCEGSVPLIPVFDKSSKRRPGVMVLLSAFGIEPCSQVPMAETLRLVSEVRYESGGSRDNTAVVGGGVVSEGKLFRVRDTGVWACTTKLV